ncbi:hypothetical protein PoB_006618200 [Plakobranchus ocellatus]|uniref:Uncharacterized protein n=1 Tax=Plakobranchus ocellatus TaxID=259542 RepID=A0AAV4D653_9GAST|nr:hypothetical protein PoB_006618200 [Plakobranchus ocellatus]
MRDRLISGTMLTCGDTRDALEIPSLISNGVKQKHYDIAQTPGMRRVEKLQGKRPGEKSQVCVCSFPKLSVRPLVCTEHIISVTGSLKIRQTSREA